MMNDETFQLNAETQRTRSFAEKDNHIFFAFLCVLSASAFIRHIDQ